MLDTAIKFLVDEANSYLRRRALSQDGLGEVLLGPLVDDAGKWATAADNVGFTLVNVEEDRVMRAQLPDVAYVNGSHVKLAPALKLNLVLLAHVRASSGKYDQSLRFLSNLMGFFQAYAVFSPETHPGLDRSIERLIVEMIPLSTEQLNQMWSYLGSKYLPSVVYRVRMLVIQEPLPTEVAKPIVEIIGRVNAL